MRTVFITTFFCLVIASVVMALMEPKARIEGTVLYWMTDMNSARLEQVGLFHAWLEKHGYPRIELRIDATNNDDTKKILQGVSGVAGDLIDMYSFGTPRYLHEIGLLEDISDAAKRGGFDPSLTFESLLDEITIVNSHGIRQQYAFPRSVMSPMYYVNLETLKKYGQPIPSRNWTIQQFETAGKAFVAAANTPDGLRRYFWADTVDITMLRRGMGLLEFNETGTRCILDDERNVRVLELFYRWTYVDHLIPSGVDVSAFATENVYGGRSAYLFNEGNFALFFGNRNWLVQFREFNEKRRQDGKSPMDLTVVEAPHQGFPNRIVGSHMTGVYAGSSHKDLAMYFLAFLASEDYNMQVIQSGDSLPPNPVFTKRDAYLQPLQFPGEWEINQAFEEGVHTAIGGTNSPFIQQRVWQRIEGVCANDLMGHRIDARTSATNAADRINEEIQRNLQDDPSLMPLYEQLNSLQQKIDERRSLGQKIPLEWLKNPFHQAYYKFKGWVEEPQQTLISYPK